MDGRRNREDGKIWEQEQGEVGASRVEKFDGTNKHRKDRGLQRAAKLSSQVMVE